MNPNRIVNRPKFLYSRLLYALDFTFTYIFLASDYLLHDRHFGEQCCFFIYNDQKLYNNF